MVGALQRCARVQQASARRGGCSSVVPQKQPRLRSTSSRCSSGKVPLGGRLPPRGSCFDVKTCQVSKTCQVCWPNIGTHVAKTELSLLFCHESLKLLLLFLRIVNNKKKEGLLLRKHLIHEGNIRSSRIKKKSREFRGLASVRSPANGPASHFLSSVRSLSKSVFGFGEGRGGVRLLHGPGVLPANGPSAFLGKRSIRSACFSKKVTLIRKACISDSTE